ncbi:type II toxin-antitoxin system Phd/YefM family antitoxin [Candidatus Dependentiae bacterium]|nr:type II toxin-antitoxin system Phd/YefM family antitoxin [Candidatus Dependentiae bacterium]
MIENIVSMDKIHKNINSVIKELTDDEPFVIIDNDKPEYVFMTYNTYEKLLNTVKVFNSEYLNKN